MYSKILFAFVSNLLCYSICIGQTGKVGINTTTPQAMLHVKDSSVLFSGAIDISINPANTPASGNGVRMMWYPDKAAFRAGRAIVTNWDKDNVGNYSFATGDGTRAAGQSSVAMGFLSYSDGNFSIAGGYNALAIGASSIALGGNTIATGNSSAALGSNINSRAYSSLSIGRYNDSIISSSTTEWVDTDPIFIIGNGTNSLNRSNALIVLKNGNTGIGENAPDVSLQLNGGVAYNAAGYSANTATTNITVGNRTYIRISSNDTDPANRKITLSDGLTIGQMLIIQCTGTGFRIEDADANIELQNASPTMNFGIDDTLSLIWDGGEWVELHRSDN